MPEARVAVAHGQMNEHTLEQVMVDFWERRFDVLVCTTIVEAGLDIATANTLLIERADLLGLSQLHQLRGRVGRSRERGYAYSPTLGHVDQVSGRCEYPISFTIPPFPDAAFGNPASSCGQTIGMKPAVHALHYLRGRSLRHAFLHKRHDIQGFHLFFPSQIYHPVFYHCQTKAATHRFIMPYILDASVKRPISALRFIPRHCGVL